MTYKPPAGVGRTTREPLQRPWAMFRADLVRSGRVWARAPALVLLTAGLWLAYYGVRETVTSGGARGVVGLLSLPIGLFLAGFSGTQRIWYLRIYRRRSLRAGEILPLTYAFFGRMVVLGLVTFTPFIVAFIVAGTIIGVRGASGGASPTHLSALLVLAVAACALVVDVALTFVLPALTFSTTSVRDALGRGLRMLRETWPASAWYALTPGLTLPALGFALPRSALGHWGKVLVGVSGALLALWFKGAVVAFYLRNHPEVGGDGAALRTRSAA